MARGIGAGMTPAVTELGTYVRKRRLHLKLSQAELARRTGVTTPYISGIERGRTDRPSMQVLVLLASALQCDVAELKRRRSLRKSTVARTDLAQLISARRTQLHLDRDDLAAALGCSPSLVRSWENGNSKRIGYRWLSALERALVLDKADLMPFVGQARRTPSTVGARLIRERRIEMGLSMADLAILLGVTRQYISLMEQGKSKLKPGSRVVTKLVQVLRLDASAIHPNHESQEGAMHRLSIGFSDMDWKELEQLKVLLDEPKTSRAVVRAVRLARRMTEIRRDGYEICTKKGGEITQLQILF